MSQTTFTDGNDHTWQLALNVAAVRRVRDDADIDLLALDDQATLAKLIYDPMGLGMVLWVLCEKQALERDLSPEQFAEGLDGDAIANATDALLQAITAFSRPAQRPLLTRAIQRMQEAEAAASAQAMTQLNEMQLPGEESTPGNSSGRPLASSASTPGR